MKPFRTAAGAAALVLAAGAAHAQGPDARVLPRGILEVGALGIFSGYNERFDGGRQPLGPAFEALLQPRADSLVRAAVGPLRSSLNGFFAATGGAVNTDDLSGGTVTALLSGDARDVPVRIALGLTNRITVDATLPLSRRGTSVRGIFLEDGTIGANPDAALNRRLLERAGASFGPLGGGAFLPLEGTTAGDELRARLRAIDPAAGDSLRLPTRGVSIPELLSDATRAGLLSPAEVDALTLRGGRTSFLIGDLELGARFRLAGEAPLWGIPSDSVFVRGFRAAAGARVRLPTGRVGRSLFLLEEPALRGHFGVGGDVAADWFLSRRWWVTGSAETQILFGANVTRLAFTAANPFPDTSQTRVIRREPGALVAASVTPRYRLTNEFSFAAQYRFAAGGAVTYSGEGSEFLGPILGVQARTAHQLGIGASYTTVAAYAAGQAPFPIDVSLLYARTLAGTGGAPADTRLELGFRAYYPAFGRRRAAPAAPPAPPADTTRTAPAVP
jgi:hypothetical protein